MTAACPVTYADGSPACGGCDLASACVVAQSLGITRQRSHPMDERGGPTLGELIVVCVAVIAGGIGGLGVAAARGAWGRPVTQAQLLAYAAIGAAGAVASLVVDLFGLMFTIVPVRVIDGGPMLARMIVAGILTSCFVMLVQQQGVRILERHGISVQFRRNGDGNNDGEKKGE